MKIVSVSYDLNKVKGGIKKYYREVYQNSKHGYLQMIPLNPTPNSTRRTVFKLISQYSRPPHQT